MEELWGNLQTANKNDKIKLIKKASGEKQIKISRKQWEGIGKKAGWIKEAGPLEGQVREIMAETLEKQEFRNELVSSFKSARSTGNQIVDTITALKY